MSCADHGVFFPATEAETIWYYYDVRWVQRCRRRRDVASPLIPTRPRPLTPTVAAPGTTRLSIYYSSSGDCSTVAGGPRAATTTTAPTSSGRYAAARYDNRHPAEYYVQLSTVGDARSRGDSACGDRPLPRTSRTDQGVGNHCLGDAPNGEHADLAPSPKQDFDSDSRTVGRRDRTRDGGDVGMRIEPSYGTSPAHQSWPTASRLVLDREVSHSDHVRPPALRVHEGELDGTARTDVPRCRQDPRLRSLRRSQRGSGRRRYVQTIGSPPSRFAASPRWATRPLREADLFGATTSGQVMLYDEGGRLLFSGGSLRCGAAR